MGYTALHGSWLIYVSPGRKFLVRRWLESWLTWDLQGVFPKRFKVTTLRDNADTYPEDLALRDWDKGEVNRLWIGDITYLRTWEGWLYLAVVMDAHSRRVIGWAIDETMTADLEGVKPEVGAETGKQL